MPNPLPSPGVKGRLFFSNTGDNGGHCLAIDTGSDWKRIVLDHNVGATKSKFQTMEDSSVGIVDGGRAGLQYTEAADIDGGSASL